VRGLFITATGTGVGKTVLAGALLASMLAAGETVCPYKPVITGLDEPAPRPWPADDELLAGLAALAREQVAPQRFGVAASPHLAASLAGTAIDTARMVDRAHVLAGDGARARTLLVEGVGGLMVPLNGDYLVQDLARDLGLPVVIAALPGLGTINHTLLTLAAARHAGLDVRAVVLTPWPSHPQAVERSNRDTIARVGNIEVHILQRLPGPDPVELARAGNTLPWREWCCSHESTATHER
jgi:dethiobiotin synthetase